MLNYLVNFLTCASLIDVSDLVNIISHRKVVLYIFLLALIVTVSKYFATMEVAYLA